MSKKLTVLKNLSKDLTKKNYEIYSRQEVSAVIHIIEVYNIILEEKGEVSCLLTERNKILEIAQAILDHYDSLCNHYPIDVKRIDLFFITCTLPFIHMQNNDSLTKIQKIRMIETSAKICVALLEYSKKSLKDWWVKEIVKRVIDSLENGNTSFNIERNGMYFSFRSASCTQIKWAAILDKYFIKFKRPIGFVFKAISIYFKGS